MYKHFWLKGFALLAILIGTLSTHPQSAPGQAMSKVDVALVLAVDASGSIDSHRWQLQLKGYADAFRSEEIIDAIVGGRRGAIAVTVVQWSGQLAQDQTIGWTILQDADTIHAFAAKIGSMPRIYSGKTSISGGLIFSAQRFGQFTFAGARRVIDVSGDGKNNEGDEPAPIRDGIVKDRVTINGLPILHELSRYYDPELPDYYRNNVIGGRGAFMEVAKNFNDFDRAIKKKLLGELTVTQR